MEKRNQEKETLHIRNKHRDRYDFSALIQTCPELSSHLLLNKYGNETIDFADPYAVKALNKALLQYFYQIKSWDIPAGYLCPPIPGRADYIHYAADLLATADHQKIPKGKKVKVLDIGTGANCIYPIIGHREYGWSFVGADIDELAVRNAKNIVDINPNLQNNVEIRWQANKSNVLKNIINKEERFDLIICNPPFHSSAEEALAGSQRKTRNLGSKHYIKPVLNFGGQHQELWTEGGEVGFIRKMIEESRSYTSQCLWFTSLISKSEHLDQIAAMLERAGVAEKRMNEMKTGNKITRIIAWTFLNVEQQAEWIKHW
jgi:23S rRNA (adenine1618-N6)-methyltransferase